jgi:integrase
VPSVGDRWHRSRPRPGDPLCAEHGKVPTADHGKGDRWQVRYRDSLGVQRKENFDRKPAADARAKVIGGEQVRGDVVDPSAGRVTFREFAEDWRRTRQHDVPTSIRVESELRRHVYPVIGSRSLRELAARPSILQAWIAGMALAPNTIRLIITDVSAILNTAAADGIVSRNPLRTTGISRPKVPEHRAQPWTLDQVTAVADAIGAMTHAARYAALPYLGAGTGMRQGELFAVAVDDIDFLRRRVHIRRQVRYLQAHRPAFAPVKNNKVHSLPLADSLTPILSEHIRRYPPVEVTLPSRTLDGEPETHALLFTAASGKVTSRSNFNEHVWRPALAAAGIERNRRNGCHVLRHTAASAWLAAGVDLPTVASYLGDTIAVVARTYAHMTAGADDRARAALDAFFTGAAPSALNVPAGAVRDA